MESLKELSKDDLNLIIEALEHLPEKNEASFLMASLTTGIFCRSKEEKKRELTDLKKQHGEEKRDLKEKAAIVAGKITALKRQLYPN